MLLINKAWQCFFSLRRKEVVEMRTPLLRYFALLGYALSIMIQSASGQQEESHWSFQPLRNVTIPHLESAWPENPIDSFILEKLNDAQLQPAGRATADQLTNRLYLDMLGILPTSDPLLSLTDDDSTSSWSQLVDQVLASPYYGERWGRH